MDSRVLLLLLIKLLQLVYSVEEISHAMVHNWAEKLGGELWHCGLYVTKMEEIEKRFRDDKEVSVQPRSGDSLIKDIARDIKNMTDLKISAVRRIMDAAENTAMSHKDEKVTEFEYYNVKRLKAPGEPLEEGEMEMLLTPNKHFNDIPVNTSYSAVHVPTNVYDGAPDILTAIKWSNNLDTIFTNNYAADPSLSWQYFGSSTGFMRQFPAMQWRNETVDMYDCRTRTWYIEAASSPKDVLILVDNSGSMTGMRKEIARHVVNNILDTLGNNDYVNVFNFSDEVGEVVPCLGDELVQANLANVREIKLGMKELHTDKIANFTAALTRSFELLQKYRDERKGACCNQAIMLITDGVPYNFKEIFEKYNWQDLPFMPVRVFTYLIGREVPDVREVKWMACANRGYYVHLSTLAEVREQVLQYIPVMARPMVLWKNEHPTIWTPVYADIEDPKMTDWLWEKKECEEQRDLYLSIHYGKIPFMSLEEQDRSYVHRYTEDTDNWSKYRLMTSVSMPVYDRRENASRIANLLGVAGTDVPIQDIQKLFMSHKLGVNGYAFIITNNGFVLTHPDLRPVFQGILKPAYNAVDMAEVELIDDNREPRDINPEFLELREKVVNQGSGTKVFKVKQHYDSMRRASLLKRHYYYAPIENTPFTLVVTIPYPYGESQVEAHLEIHRLRSEGTDVTQYFQGNWKIHPEWAYCSYLYESEHHFESPEKQLYHFLERTQQPKWQWKSKRTVTPPEHASQFNTSGGSEKFDKDSYYCDRELFLSLAFDAKVTEFFTKEETEEDKDDQFQERFGVTISFVATRSGLTRWKDYPGMEENKKEPHFSTMHNRAIDEIWYKRAVEQYEFDNKSFVYSVPFDAKDKNHTLVTASHAVYLHDPATNRKAPAAVVGFQFRHSALHVLFKNITYTCHAGVNCHNTCSSEDLECYMLDNNGFVIVSEDIKHTGMFFGEIHGDVMKSMVLERIYDRIRIYDYQAVCFRGEDIKSDATSYITPYVHMISLLKWVYESFICLITEFSFYHILFGFGAHGEVAAPIYDSYDGSSNFFEDEDEEFGEEEDGGPIRPTDPPYEKMLINRTRPESCDTEMYLYNLVKHPLEGVPYASRHVGCDRPYVVQRIPSSNMVLVVVDTLCSAAGKDPVSVMPTEVYYNDTLACHKVHNFILHRVRPKSCINNHTKESEIEHLCGSSTTPYLSYILFLWIISFIIFHDWR